MRGGRARWSDRPAWRAGSVHGCAPEGPCRSRTTNPWHGARGRTRGAPGRTWTRIRIRVRARGVVRGLDVDPRHFFFNGDVGDFLLVEVDRDAAALHVVDRRSMQRSV